MAGQRDPLVFSDPDLPAVRPLNYCPAMASVIKPVSSDAADPRALAAFWAAALGSDVHEAARLEGLGATVVQRHEHPTVMQDLEGNSRPARYRDPGRGSDE
jgi:hypothetical protein